MYKTNFLANSLPLQEPVTNSQHDFKILPLKPEQLKTVEVTDF